MDLLERDAHLRVLWAALEQAQTDTGRVLLVSGEAGIGKTALVRSFLGQQPASQPVWWGACDSLITPRPLGPFQDIALQVGGKMAEALAAEHSQPRLYPTVLAALRHEPVILVIEDIHWADDASLDLLKYIGRRIHQTQALLLLTYRDDQLDRRHPLRVVLGEFATQQRAQTLRLAGLSLAAVSHLAASQDIDPVSLHRQTNGNPFFVTEILATGGGIPHSVRDAVLARAAQLSPAGRAVLDAGSVIGARIEPWLLAEAVGPDAGPVDECISVGMLQAQGDLLAFRHELSRQTILDALSPLRSTELHRRVLAGLLGNPSTHSQPARIAHHAAAAGDQVVLRQFAPLAGRQAAAAHAHREAAAQFELALRAADGLGLVEHAQLLEEYARESNTIDQREKGIQARLQASELWREVGNPTRQAANLAACMVMYFGIGKTDQAEEVSRRAIEILEALPPSRELAEAYRTQATLRMFVRDIPEAIAWGDKAIQTAQIFNDQEILAHAYNAIGSAWMVVDFQKGRDYLERSLSVAQAAGLDGQIANAYTNLGSASGEVYRFIEAERYLREGIAFATERDLDVSRLYMLAWQAITALHLGRWEEAGESAQAVLRYPGTSAISRIMALLALGRLRARRGDPQVWEALDEALNLAEQSQTLQRIGPVRAARAEAAWLSGNLARAGHEARASAGLAEQKRHPWLAGELLYWRWRAGEPVGVPEWAAAPFAAQVNGDWQTAAALWRALGCPYEEAIALAEGDPAAQFSALKIFDQLGARPAYEKIRQEMQARKVPGIPRGPRPSTRANRFGLTTREMQVLGELGAGLSNAEIGERLNISTRTVEHHLSVIFSKMAVQNRAEAISLALRSQLISS